MADLYLKNATIVNESGEFRGGVVIEGEKIAKVVEGVPDIDSQSQVDIDGKILMPGIVDSHVHFEDPGKTEWEEFSTGCMAAAAGGITTVMDMPVDSEPPTTSCSNYQVKLDAIAPKAITDFALWGGLVDNNLDNLESLDAEGVIGFKAFMEETGVDSFKCAKDDILFAGLKKVSELGNLVAVHAENDWVVRYLVGKLQAEGRTDRRAWIESRPIETEAEAIQRAVYWAQVTGGNLHVVHATTAAGVKSVAKAKLLNAHVTVETGPNFLFFDEDDFLRLGPLLKMGPSVRPRAEVEKLWECVLAGDVDVIGSDHSPSSWMEKAPGENNVWKGWGGVGGIQSMLPVMLTEGVHKRGLKLSDLVRMMSGNPARLFGIYPQKGNLSSGADADLVIIDLDKKWTLREDQLLSKNTQSPYIGYEYQGKVERTILRGETIYQDGKILAKPGFGKLLRRGSRYAGVKA